MAAALRLLGAAGMLSICVILGINVTFANATWQYGKMASPSAKVTAWPLRRGMHSGQRPQSGIQLLLDVAV